MSFSYRGLECKSRKSRDTWSNRQVWLSSTKWSRSKANRVLLRERTGHSNTLFQQHKGWLYTWTSPDGQHRNQIDYILCSQRWKSSIRAAKTRPGADCGSDHELLIAQFRLKWKKVGKFRYNLNSVGHSSLTKTKSLMTECLKNYGWRMVTLLRRQWPKPSPRIRNARRQRGCLRRPYKQLIEDEEQKAVEQGTWQTMFLLSCWRAWEATPVFLPREPHEQSEKLRWIL